MNTLSEDNKINKNNNITTTLLDSEYFDAQSINDEYERLFQEHYKLVKESEALSNDIITKNLEVYNLCAYNGYLEYSLALYDNITNKKSNENEASLQDHEKHFLKNVLNIDTYEMTTDSFKEIPMLNNDSALNNSFNSKKNLKSHIKKSNYALTEDTDVLNDFNNSVKIFLENNRGALFERQLSNNNNKNDNMIFKGIVNNSQSVNSNKDSKVSESEANDETTYRILKSLKN